MTYFEHAGDDSSDDLNPDALPLAKLEDQLRGFRPRAPRLDTSNLLANQDEVLSTNVLRAHLDFSTIPGTVPVVTHYGPMLGSWVFGVAVGAVAMFGFFSLDSNNSSNNIVELPPVDWQSSRSVQNNPSIDISRSSLSIEDVPPEDWTADSRQFLASLLIPNEFLDENFQLDAGYHLRGKGKQVSTSSARHGYQERHSETDVNRLEKDKVIDSSQSELPIESSQSIPVTRERLLRDLMDTPASRVF